MYYMAHKQNWSVPILLFETFPPKYDFCENIWKEYVHIFGNKAEDNMKSSYQI